ncbi:Ferredoxin--NADP reductase [Pandoraea anapnoica]|uniref:Ferredoxin--NADP reductase n=1 Tax=Pandoraea anapnoica TaxID=2508301 RepID=A0A5E5A771_9BURK|nr:hypothetical protein [Pandoraea anapnoica]VVE67960.1 Ferredoxin--NADP reductase [Pandoraea anapnoica]
MQAQTTQTKYSPQTVTGMHFWTPTIFSIKTTRPPACNSPPGSSCVSDYPAPMAN